MQDNLARLGCPTRTRFLQNQYRLSVFYSSRRKILGNLFSPCRTTLSAQKKHRHETGAFSMRAARQGLEPRYHGPKPCVLPLDDRAIFFFYFVQVQSCGLDHYMICTGCRYFIQNISQPLEQSPRLFNLDTMDQNHVSYH